MDLEPAGWEQQQQNEERRQQEEWSERFRQGLDDIIKKTRAYWAVWAKE